MDSPLSFQGEMIMSLYAKNEYLPTPSQVMLEHVGGPGADKGSFHATSIGIALDLFRLGFFQNRVATIVDIGCGCGRIALSIAQLLSEKGRYYGFDTWAEGIEWAANNVSRLYPNFVFTLLTQKSPKESRLSHSVKSMLDECFFIARALGIQNLLPASRKAWIKNRLVHKLPTIAYSGHDYQEGKAHAGYQGRKPYALTLDSSSCDIVLATSLFTHLDYEAAHAYMLEMARIMKKGAWAYVTFFLYDDESLSTIRLWGSTKILISDRHAFYHITGEYFTSYFPAKTVEAVTAEAGLRILTKRLGFWRGEQHKMAELPINYQDLFILEKVGDN